MKFWLGVTHNRWFEFLASRRFEEVNFWQPRPRVAIRNLVPGAPFLFKLKRPNNHIAGGGYFVNVFAIPLSLAWESFREKNGAASIHDLRKLIMPLRGGSAKSDPEIGCYVLNKPFFFPEEMWIGVPENWSKNIQRGKSYDSESRIGHAVWEKVSAQLSVLAGSLVNPAIGDDEGLYGDEFLTKARFGQGAFRVLVTEAYGRRCAITGERTLPVLEAAHIKPFSEKGPNIASNGLLLRSDFHKLFDRGYVTVTEELRVEVSPRIREEWFNGRAYYSLHGNRLAIVPKSEMNLPRKNYLAWHNEAVYLE